MDSTNQIRSILASSNRSFAQGSQLVERLAKQSGLQRDVVIESLNVLKRNGEISCPDWHRGEPVGRVQLNIEKIKTDAERNLEQALNKHNLSEADKLALMEFAAKLEGMTNDDLDYLITGLIRLRHDLPKLNGQSRYLVSAKYLMGSSKTLDALPNHALRAFGVDPEAFAAPPSYVLIAGPQQPESVILIENPQAMELAIQAGIIDRIALVATYGYGLSRSGEEYGMQLANLVENKTGMTGLVRTGQPPVVMDLLRHEKIYFWGDLDREGMRIYWRLKSNLPALKLSSLYEPMMDMITCEKNSHPYINLVAKPNQKDWRCDDATVQKLLDTCKYRAVDQEVLSVLNIQRYAYNEFK